MPQHTQCHLPHLIQQAQEAEHVVHVHFCLKTCGNPEVASVCVQQQSLVLGYFLIPLSPECKGPWEKSHFISHS